MAEAGAAGSIPGVVTFGLQLATTIHTYVEAVWEAKDRLRDVAFDINSTASTLKQLQALLNADQEQATKVFRDDGVNEIRDLAIACGKVYSTIVILLTKAGSPDQRGKVLAEAVNPLTLKTSCLTRHMRWAWLAPRIKRCQGQLRLFKTKLILMLQLANLTRVQLGLPERQPGSFQEELTLRALSIKLRKKELRTFRILVDKYVPEEGNASDASSIMSLKGLQDFRIDDKAKSGYDSDEVVIEEREPPKLRTKVNEPNDSTSSTSQPEEPATENVNETLAKDEADVDDNASECGTLVDEPQNGKSVDADLKKPVAEEVVAPPPPPPAPVEVKEEPKPEEPKDQPQCTKTNDGKKAEADKPAEEIEGISLTTTSSTFSLLPRWLKNLFGKREEQFADDWESPTLECFIVSNEFKLLKLPFGHQRLTYGLKRTQRKVGLTWDQYMASPNKKEISKAINKAKLIDSRKRTCVAIGAQKKADLDFIVLFMSLGPKVDPVHFKDAVGRIFTFPYESCRTWETVKKIIEEAFLHVEVLGPHVHAGHFDLIGPNGSIILPSLWTSLIQPGDHITMHMWPMPEPIRQGPPGFLGTGPPPPPPGWQPGGPPPPRPRMPGPPNPPPPPGWVGQWPPPPRPRSGPPVIVTPPPPIVKMQPKKKPQPVSIFSWMAGKPAYRRRRAYWSDSDSEDGSELMSDSDIENEDVDVELAINFEKEEENAKLGLGELLGKFTNALDTLGGNDLDSDADSVSSSSSGSLIDD